MKTSGECSVQIDEDEIMPSPKLEMWDCQHCREENNGTRTRFPADFARAIQNHLVNAHPWVFREELKEVREVIMGEPRRRDGERIRPYEEDREDDEFGYPLPSVTR